MKNENKKTDKIVVILNYFAGICFYISAILNFINNDNSMGFVYLGLGSICLCFGIIYLNKYKKSKNNK